ncbi:hypothetical protein EIN_470500 [Entamoeba invadens IP1]|uniref:TLDc domain-containing protein n=1 Tax=Entamoeba invadens IP1 TaxID=370355 RepID=A0A0A1TZ28_ENTIV|nr:hypothetical protein EIN_470500 [Entamoeba invadens IP1]ELP83786.1 hypothetical protein EIN_470500 [Entamoeba invadens IP1]|eukprot:XP_004183132.1 hypothetical protein EIN_470500 [Entamoeba invadens IP1]
MKHFLSHLTLSSRVDNHSNPEKMVKVVFKQLETMTSRKIDTVLFDSDIDNAAKNCNFCETIVGRSNLLFVVITTEHLIFGGYKDLKVEKNEAWLTDPNAFLFKVIEGPNPKTTQVEKYPINPLKATKAFYLYENDYDVMFSFGFGLDLCICKTNSGIRYHTRCKQDTYVCPAENTMCGKEKFEWERVIVIQMM